MPKLRVEVAAAELRRFRRQAAKYFPHEILSLLIGEVSGGCVSIHHITSPPIVGERMEVEISNEDWNVARDMARNEGLRIVGSIHTHPFSPTKLADGPSTDDVHGAATCNEKVWSICYVWKPEGGRFKTRIDWFGGGPQLEVEVV